MTTPESYGQFGQTLAFAERTLTEVLRRHLAQRGVVPETWYALKLIATGGPGLSRRTLSDNLARSRNLDPESTSKLLARLEADGLIRGEMAVDLTEDGGILYRSLQEFVTGPTAELLTHFDIDDINTTVRTLQGLTQRALEGLEVARGG
jgi:DNA-binding MarR family transcriptional regulator